MAEIRIEPAKALALRSEIRRAECRTEAEQQKFRSLYRGSTFGTDKLRDRPLFGR